MATNVTQLSDAPFLTPQSLRPFSLIGLSAVALVTAFAIPETSISTSVLGAGAGLAAAGVIVAALQIQDNLRRWSWRRGHMSIVRTDPDSALMVDVSGHVAGHNSRADDWLAGDRRVNISDLLAREFPSGAEIASRMTGEAQIFGFSEETFRSGKALVRLSVQTLPGGLSIWRRREQPLKTTPDIDSIQHPLAAVSQDGALVWANSAAKRILDGSGKDQSTGCPIGSHEGAFSLGWDGETELFSLPVPGDDDRFKARPETTRYTKELAPELPVPVITLSTDGDILSANASARALLNLQGGALPKFYDLVEGMGRPISEWLADAAKGRGLIKSEFVHAVLPGRDLYLQITLGRMHHGDEIRLIGILNDATELKTLEAQFVQSQKMQAIGQLAGGVAHDFNNLLTAISGHCDLLLLRHDAGDPDYSDLMQIAQNANRAAALVGQLLAFSRKQTLKPQPLDLRDTMSELTHLLNRLIGEKITLDLRVGHTERVIRADRRQFEQVIMNLVVNARDAMQSGGRIEIGAEDVMLAEAMSHGRAEIPAGEYVLVRVADSGTGIEPDKLPKIFEPFFTTKKTGEGTGLGLSTVYGIVKQSGGYIFAESEVGKGTTFDIYFPAQARPTAEKAKKPAANQPALSLGNGAGVVLLVEDESPVRAFASRALKMRGYTIVEAECAEDALRKLEDMTLSVDLIVTDVIMPGMDGPTWVRKALETRPDTRVVFMSGYAEEGLAENQSRIPNSVFLPKPFSLGELTAVVQRQLT